LSLFNAKRVGQNQPFCYIAHNQLLIVQANDHQKSQLNRLRLYAGLTQKELSERTDIPLRTIQQYEQGQKDISHARADSIVKLAKALYCNVEEII